MSNISIQFLPHFCSLLPVVCLETDGGWRGGADSEREMAAKDMTRVKQMKERQKGEEIRWQMATGAKDEEELELIYAID